MTLSSQLLVKNIARRYPRSIHVFEREGVDFYNQGDQRLHQVLASRPDSGLGKDLDEVAAQGECDDDLARVWQVDPVPVKELIDDILKRYHLHHQALLTELERNVSNCHQHYDNTTTSRLRHQVLALAGELRQHMAKEEQILFPMIDQLLGNPHAPSQFCCGPDPRAPMRVMEMEHDQAAQLVDSIKQESNQFQSPDWAGSDLDQLYAQLQELAIMLHTHMHVENNILFPAIKEMAESELD